MNIGSNAILWSTSCRLVEQLSAVGSVVDGQLSSIDSNNDLVNSLLASPGSKRHRQRKLSVDSQRYRSHRQPRYLLTKARLGSPSSTRLGLPNKQARPRITSWLPDSSGTTKHLNKIETPGPHGAHLLRAIVIDID